MRLPHALALTGSWIALWITNAFLAPVAMNYLEMLGGFLSVMIGFALMLAALAIVLLGVGRSWRMRSGKTLAAQAIVPFIGMVLVALFLTAPAAELSWQSVHGPRDVPIWRLPYQR